MSHKKLLPLTREESKDPQMNPDNTASLPQILDEVFQVTGIDFRGYRQTTVRHRLDRRLQAAGAGTYDEYLEMLRNRPEEYEKLIDYMTITVSDFLRTPYTFQQVVRLVLPELVSRKSQQANPGLKFWSAATARGQEAYSIAFVLADYLGNQLNNFEISIHATDINRRGLTQAKTGRYPAEGVTGLPHGILERYFTRTAEGYEVNSDIRKAVVFSYFNLASTEQPPFSNLDCVFCCNILIYLQQQAQEKVVNTLYDSLANGGYLVLGEVETPPSDYEDKLKVIDYKAKIYQKIRGNGNAQREKNTR